MAVVGMVGFEAGQAATDNIILTGTAAYDTGKSRTGARSIRCNPASGVQGYISLNGIAGSSGFWHFAINIASLPSVARVIAGNGSGSNLLLNTDGTISLRDTSTVRATSSTALSAGTDTWYWIGWRGTAGTSVDGLQINGVTEGNGTLANAGAGRVGACLTEASAVDMYIDDVIVDDAGFLSNGKVDIALPISDNTVTGVTDNNGVTTNIFDCLDNTPPAGVASANEAANPKVGMHFPASVTCDYLANLETYTTLGIGASDTILAVRGVVRHGEDIATGTKNLQNVGALTNPTVGGSSVTAGGDGGAHGAEAGFWVTTFGTLTTSPSVTLGTSPTIRTSRVSEARVACADFMGMVVAWTPVAAVERVPKYQPMPQLLAQ